MINLFSRFGRRRGGGDQQGRGRGDGTKPGSGLVGECVCPQCGHKTRHRVGERCVDLKCPKCGTSMVRG